MRTRLLIVWCLLLVGCASGSGGAQRTAVATNAAGGRPAGTAEAIAPTTITVWHPWTGRQQQALDSLARAFEQQRPMIRIRLERQAVAHLVRQYQERVSDGSAPQLVLLHGRYIQELAEGKLVQPVDGLYPIESRPAFLPAAWESGRVQDQQYGVPLTLDALVLWYDRRVLVTPPTDLSQLPSTVQPTFAPQDFGTATPEPLATLAYHLSLATTLPYLYALGGQLTTAADPIAFAHDSRPATVRWLEGLQSLATRPLLRASDDLSVVDQALQTGQALSVIDWSHRRDEYAQVWGEASVGVAALPRASVEGQPPPTLIMTDMLCVNAVMSDVQRKATFEFLLYLTSAEAQTTLAKQAGVLPANNDATVDEPLRLLREVLVPPTNAGTTTSTEPTAMPLPADSRVWTVLDDMVQSVLGRNVPPEQAIDTAAAALPATLGTPVP